MSVLENELGEEYYFSAPHSKDVESQFLKIHKKDTIFSDIFDKCEPLLKRLVSNPGGKICADTEDFTPEIGQ